MTPSLLLAPLLSASLTGAEWFSAPEPVDSAFRIISSLEAPDRVTLRTRSRAQASMRRKAATGWSLDLNDDYGYGLRLLVSFQTDPSEDDLYRSRDAVVIQVVSLPEEETLHTFRSSDGLNLNGGDNLWRLAHADGTWTLTAGCGVPSSEFQIPFPAFTLNHIAFRPDAPGTLSLPEIILRQTGRMVYEEPADPLLRLSSEDSATVSDPNAPKEGLWRILDYSLDEDRAILGGDYILRLVREDDADYMALLYERGAIKMPGDWKPGDLKGRLIPTGIPCIYDLEWRSASGRRLRSGLRAEYEPTTEILTLHFPARGTTLRFAPVTLPRPTEVPRQED